MPAPLGLNTDMFLAQQKEMSDYFANGLRDQLQNFAGQAVEALIVGSDGDGAHIYEVDFLGTVRCMDDVGFAAIGAGAWHAKSQLMQTGYTKTNTYAYALAQTYAAKRPAEVAPGVGSRTDINVVLSDRWVHLPDDTRSKLEQLYGEYRTCQDELAIQTVAQLQEFLDATRSPSRRNNCKRRSG